jgi:hypothetical protein
LIKRVNEMNRIEKLTASDNFQELLDNLEPLDLTPDTAADLLPEECAYRDEGCELAPACLYCPFPSCSLDLPAGQGSLKKEYRDQAIREGFKKQGMSVAALARQFAVSERTVRRAIKKNEIQAGDPG